MRKSLKKKGRAWLPSLIGCAAAAGSLALARKALARKYSFAGKTVFITGGSRGLGLVLAREFAKRGARVAICARDEAELARASADLQKSGYSVKTFRCDVTDQAQVNTTLASVREQLGEIDVLVNNAGVISVGPMETMTVEDYQESLATHFWAPLYTMMNLLPEMRRRKAGRIVNISSIGGTVSVPHLLPYSTGKFALAGLSEGVRCEASKDGVFVTTVYPGLLRTGSPRNAFFKGNHRAEYAWFSISAALPLFSISAEHAARAIVSACARGKSRIVLSVPAKIAAAGFHLFPESAALLSLAARMLPGDGGTGRERRPGKESTSSASPSILTVLNERAAARNNELAG